MRAPVAACPECGGGVYDEGGWPPWCPRCEWGLPNVADDERNRWQRWRARRMHARVIANHQRLLGTDLRASGARRSAGLLLAVLVHLVTALLVVVAAWIWTTGTFPVAKAIATVLLLAIAWEVRPRLGRVPQHDRVLTRVTAPRSFALLDEVSRAIGSRSPDVLVVSADFNASIGRRGLRRQLVLTLGLPLWEALDDRQRLAALGHELGHEVNRDVRSTLLVGTAIESLRRWAWLLLPDTRATRQRWRVGGRSSSAGFFAFAEYLVPLILLPVSVTVALLALGLERIGARSGQRAEYRADELAAVVAGTDATVSMLDTFLSADPCMQAMHLAIQTDRDADVWATERRFLQAVTPAQRERWRRMAAREQHRTDASHPPTLLRREMLLSRPNVAGQEPTAEILATEMSALSDDLRAAEPSVARLLRESASGSASMS